MIHHGLFLVTAEAASHEGEETAFRHVADKLKDVADYDRSCPRRRSTLLREAGAESTSE